MPSDEDFDVFSGVGPGVQHHPAQQLDEHLAISFTAIE
jgi:hypothetical protein